MIGAVLVLVLVAFSLAVGSFCGFLFEENNMDDIIFLLPLIVLVVVIPVTSGVWRHMLGGMWEACNEEGCSSSGLSILLWGVVGTIIFLESTFAGIYMSKLRE